MLLSELVPPRVFVSYSHDGTKHENRALALAERLRADGIDAMIDCYLPSPPEGWPAWCDAQIRRSDFVVMICTEIYLRRVNGDEEPHVGRGVLWEGRLIKQHLYNAGSVSSKFVPVLLAHGSEAHVPAPVAGATIYRVETLEGYEALLRLLTDQPLTAIPPLGPRKELSARQRPALPGKSAEQGWNEVVPGQQGAPGAEQIATFQSLCRILSVIFRENERIFRDFGPKSGVNDDAVRWELSVWRLLRKERIVPLNTRARELIIANWDLIPNEHTEIFRNVLSHIDAFEAHVNDPSVDYRDHQFPAAIVEIVARSCE
jgi:hypothetical protein